MRRDVKKYLFYGHHKALDTFFSKAQEVGLVDFIDTSHVRTKELPADIQDVTNSIKILRELPTRNQQEPSDRSDTDQIIKKILDIKHSLERLEEEQRMARLEIVRIEVFGQFSLDDVSYIENEGDRVVQYFFAKKGLFADQEMPAELIHVNSAHGLDYFVSIAKVSKQYPRLVEMKIDDELNTLKKRVNEITVEINRYEGQLKGYVKYNQYLHHVLTEKYNDYNLQMAESYADAEMEGTLFAVEGWVPVDRVTELEKAVANIDVDIVEVAVKPFDVVPTYLENEGANRIGEDLVNIYDVPANTDKDPSLWVLLSFALFFGIIIGDGGYGLLFLLGALYFRWKNPNIKKTGKRVWKLGVILFSSCIIWGLLTNAFFGIQFHPDNPIRNVSALNWLVDKKVEYHLTQKDDVYQEYVKKYPDVAKATTVDQFIKATKKGEGDNLSYEVVNSFSDSILMELSLLIGIIHICLSLIRYINRNWAGIGWIIVIIGAYFYIPEFLKANSMMQYVFEVNRAQLASDGLYMIYIGLGLAVVIALITDRIFGLLEITNSIQIFSDILSYLRLYALALAGSIISATVNDIAGSIFYIAGGLLSVLLLVVGHGINMVLSIIGGVIHGLRLNFIEWYHYSFEGGGKAFNPLRKVEVD